jgi:hypothetical protein
MGEDEDFTEKEAKFRESRDCKTLSDTQIIIIIINKVHNLAYNNLEQFFFIITRSNSISKGKSIIMK